MAAMTLKSPLIAGAHTAGIYADMSVDGPKIGTLVLIIDRAKNLPNRKSMGKQDPYCAARLGKEAHKTNIDKRGGQTPRWDQELRFVVHDSADYYMLKISCFHDDKRTELIGETFVDLRNIICPGGGQSDQWVNLKCRDKYAGEVRIEMTYYDSRPKEEKPLEKRRESTRPAIANRESAVAGARQLRIPRRPLPANPTGSSPAQMSPERPLPGIAAPQHSGPVTQPRAPEREARNYQAPPVAAHSSNPYDFDLPPRGQSEVYHPPVAPRQLDTANRGSQHRSSDHSNYAPYEENQFAENDMVQSLRSSRGSHREEGDMMPAALKQAHHSQSQTNVSQYDPYIASSAPLSHQSVPNFQQYNQYMQSPSEIAPQIPAHKPTERSKSWNEEVPVHTPQDYFLPENSYVSEPQDMEDSPPPPPPPVHRSFEAPMEVHSVSPLSSKRASPQPHGSPPEIPSASKPVTLHKAVTEYNAMEYVAANGSPVAPQPDVYKPSSQLELFKSKSPFDRRRLSNRPVPETHHSQPILESQTSTYPRRLSGEGLFQAATPTKQAPPVPMNRPPLEEQWSSQRMSGPPSTYQTPERPNSSQRAQPYSPMEQPSSSPEYYQNEVPPHPDQVIPDESTLHRRRRSNEVARLSLGRSTGSPKNQSDNDSPPGKQMVPKDAPLYHRHAHSDSSVVQAQGFQPSPTSAGPPPAQHMGHVRQARSFNSPEQEKPETDPYRRRSHSPQPPHAPSSPLDDRHLAGTPFSPDSYNVLNPKAADGSLSKSINKSYEQRDPLYTSNPVQVRKMPAQRKVSPRFFRRSAKAPVVTPDRIVDPSDHLPSNTWAPEPDKPTPPAEPDNRRQAPQGAQPMPEKGKRAPRTATSLFSRPRPHSIAGPVEELDTSPKNVGMRLFGGNRLRKSRASTVEPTPVPSSPPGAPQETSHGSNGTPTKAPYDYSWLESTTPQRPQPLQMQSSPASQPASQPAQFQRIHKDRSPYTPMYATTSYEYHSSPPPMTHGSEYSSPLPPPLPNKIPLGTPDRREWSLEEELRSMDIGSSGGRRTTRLRQGY